MLKNRVVQDPNSVGAALRTISLRLRGTSVKELEEAGEDTTGAIESSSKLRSKIKSLSGVDILTDTGAYKSTYEILFDISKVWKDMSDIDQAALLEIIAGKTRSNTAAAILSNTIDLEKAYTSALEAEGSALAENEKYLDSIQGRIDLFNNAVQTMWSNTLDDKLIKDIVNLGTAVVKLVDEIGLIPSILAAIAAYKIIPSLIIATTHTNSLAEAMKLLAFGAKYANMSIGEILISLGKLLPVIVSNIARAAKAIPTLIQAGSAFGGLRGAIAGATAGIQGLWAAIPGVGQIMLIVGAIAAVIAIIDAVTTSTAELKEELNDLKSELQNIQSELDSLNTELETTQDRMNELLAMDSLSFTEQEELKNLQKQNAELERQIYLLEQRQKRKQKEAEKTFVDTMESDVETVNAMGNTVNLPAKAYIKMTMDSLLSTQEEVRAAEDALIQAEENLENAKTKREKKQAEKEVKNANKKYNNKKKASDDYYDYLSDKIQEYSEYADGIDYDLADDETKEYLDYIYNLEDKFNILFGDDGKAKSVAITRIFNKEEFDDLYNSLEDLQEKLRANPEDTDIISQIEEKIRSSDIEDDLDAVGLKIQDAINYWIMLGSKEDIELNAKVEVDYEKISNAIDEIQDAYSTLTDVVEQYNSTGYLTLDNLQALLSLEPEYLTVLQMENGQLSINQQAMEVLLQTQLAKAEATVIDTAITQLNTLSERAKEEAIVDSANAANNAVPVLSTYASQLSTVGQEAIIAAGKVSAFNAAVDGAVAAGVSLDDVNAVIGGMNAQFAAIQSVKTNLPKNFNSIVSPKSSGSSKDKDDAFQKEMDYWENQIGANQAKYEQLQNEIDLLEAKGKRAGEGYYQAQIELENERLKLLEKQKIEAQKYLGTFKEGSDEWWDAASTLNDLEGEIDDVTASLQDLRDAQAEVDWYIFDEAHERFSKLHDDLETIRDLLAPNQEDDWFDDEGNWTDKGTAYLASYISDLQFYEGELDSVNKKLTEQYHLPYAGNEKYYKTLGIDSEQELYDAREKLIDQQYDIRQAQSDTQQSVADMYESQIDAVEEYTNELVDAYNDYIDVVKEALDAERDLYDFKKNVQKQTKDIASLERRIASLSGSDNAADIAERRKLEAELYDAREGLNDTYYDHAKNAQSEALDKEAEAYEKSMSKFIEGLHDALDAALLDIGGFMGLVANAVVTNAPAIKEQYDGLGISLDSAIIDPWTEAADKIKAFGGIDGLGIMNSWVTEGGAIYKFDLDATELIKAPWEAGTQALGDFKTSVTTKMGEVVTSIKSNVATATGELNKIKDLYSEINSTTVKAPSSGVDNTGNQGGGDGQIGMSSASIKALQEVLNTVFKANLTVDGKYGPKTKEAITKVQKELLPSHVNGKYDAATRQAMDQYILDTIAAWRKQAGSSMIGQGIRTWLTARGKLPVEYYAKGTIGTKQSGFAVTDESWIGDEITLAAGKNGQLQYLKKGSAVMPADISTNLIEWGQLSPDMLKVGGTPNFSMISNAINKPELNMSFDSLVHVDHCDEGTLKDLEKMVDIKINQFSKQMNYAIKKIGGR